MTYKRRSDGPAGPADCLTSLAGDLRGRAGFVEKFAVIAPTSGERRAGFSLRPGGAGGPAGPAGSDETELLGPAREPLTDIIEEDEHLLITAELPGVEASEVHYDLQSPILVLDAGTGERRYYKELTLPVAVTADGARAEVRNSIFELRLPRAKVTAP